MTNPRKTLLPFVLVGALTSAIAEAACDSAKGIDDCLTERVNAALSPLVADSLKQVGDDLKGKTKPGEALARASSSLDYLSKFFVAAGLGTTKRDDGNLVFQFKPELFGKDMNRPLLLRVTAYEPKPFASLVDAVPEAGRAAFKEALSKGLEEADDLGVSVTWGLKDEVALLNRYRSLVSDVAGTAAATVIPEALERLTTLQNGLPQGLSTLGAVKAQAESGRDDEATVRSKELLAALDEAVEATVEFVKSRQVALSDAGLYRLADLIEAQPRYFLEASLRSRVEAAGPDHYYGKFRYEKGFENLTSVARTCGKRSASEVDADCYRSYIADQAAPAGKRRLAFFVEYEKSETYDFSAPQLTNLFHLDAAEKLTAAVSTSAYLNRRLQESEDGTRFDLEAKFEDVSNDPTRDDRFVATATLSQRLAEKTVPGNGMVFTVSLVYANKHEYLPESDRELSAHLGLKLKVDKN